MRAESVRGLFTAALTIAALYMAPSATAEITRDSHGHIARSSAAKHAFMHAHPCPAGVDAGSTHRCRGYVVDHIEPLACGGRDDPSNMQWQTIAEGRAKDRWERKACGEN